MENKISFIIQVRIVAVVQNENQIDQGFEKQIISS